MRSPFKFTLIALLALAPGAAVGQAALSYERAAGFGLKPPASVAATPADLAAGDETIRIRQTRHAFDYALYGGTREAPRPGLRATESYGGVVYSLAGSWGTSLEAGYAPESLFAPQRYTLTGQLHTAFAGGGVSVGLKYRTYGWDGTGRGSPMETTPANGYSLAPSRLTGGGFAPSYQLQMHYQYSTAGTFGLALGRDVETFTPFADASYASQRLFSFTGQHWLTPSWALSYDVLSNDVTTLRVQGLRLGVRYLF